MILLGLLLYDIIMDIITMDTIWNDGYYYVTITLKLLR